MKSFSEEMTFEHRQQMMRGVNSVNIWGGSFPGRWNQRFKGPEPGAKWHILRNTKKAIIARAK